MLPKGLIKKGVVREAAFQGYFLDRQLGAFQQLFGILQADGGQIGMRRHIQLRLHFFINIFGRIMEDVRQGPGSDAGRIIFIEVTHQICRQCRVGQLLGIQQAKKPEKFTLQLQMAAGRLVQEQAQPLQQRQKQAWLEGASNGKHQPAGEIFGIIGLEMDVIIFRIGAGAGSRLPGIFFLDVPFAGQQRGQAAVFCELQPVFQHENQHEMAAVTGTMVFIGAEALQAAVGKIGHGSRRKNDGIHSLHRLSWVIAGSLRAFWNGPLP